MSETSHVLALLAHPRGFVFAKESEIIRPQRVTRRGFIGQPPPFQEWSYKVLKSGSRRWYRKSVQTRKIE